MEHKEQMKHPKGLLLANITTGLQSFYAYGIVGFLILFFIASPAENGLVFLRQSYMDTTQQLAI